MSKLKVLYWGDVPAPIVHTGYAVVAQHILKALHNTDKYEIDVLGVNYFGSFYDKNETPYHIVPARLLEPQDPFGNKMLLRSLYQKKYDILFVLNDTYVTSGIAKNIQEYKIKHHPDLKVIFYYPVDCNVLSNSSDLVRIADKPVTYTNFAKNKTLAEVPEVAHKLEVIIHGTDSETFHPLSVEQINNDRYQFFGVRPEDKTFVWINVNRNSVRKNLPKTIYAFAEFKKKYPDTKLYLHTPIDENGIDLNICLHQLGLSTKTDVIFPQNYNPAQGFAASDLNRFYNASDCFISTSLGEGWGIGQCEAMAAGISVLLPDNTSTPEILQDGKNGFMYLCDESAFIDNQGYRRDGRIEDIVNNMIEVYTTSPVTKITKLQAARKFTTDNSWEIINKQWIELFDRVAHTKSVDPGLISQSL